MSERMQGRSLVSSLGFHTLCDRLNQAGAAQDALPQILWRIGAHPALIAHDRVLGNLADALGSEVFRPESLYWASSWRLDVDLWIDTIRLVSQLGPQLRAESLRVFLAILVIGMQLANL
jgi:hypothetical protein